MAFGFFKKKNTQQETSNLQDLNDIQRGLAEYAMSQKDYATALKHYTLAAEEGNDPHAQYNLGIMYAQGLGVEKNYLKAGAWINKSIKNENSDKDSTADKILLRTQLDYYKETLAGKSPETIWRGISEFQLYVFGDNSLEKRLEALQSLAVFYYNKKEHGEAGRIFRSMAEYGSSVLAQFNLGLFYLNGVGVEKNDLSALYWYDRAADQEDQAAKTDRDGILNAYITNLGKEEAIEQVNILASWCRYGNCDDIPKDEVKAKYWHDIAMNI